MPRNEAESRSASRALKRWLATVALIGAIVGCYALAPVPPQSWSEAKWGPLVPHKSFPGDCALCHVPDRWDVLKPDFHFDHANATGFKLEGAHANAACLRCHNDRGPVKEFLARGCGGCHVDPHEGNLGPVCERCHDQQTFRPTGMLAEHAKTRFPLTGAHLAVTCDRCHPQAHVGDYVGAQTQCEICHQAALATATNPDHASLGWTSGCQRCHTPTAWDASHFTHSIYPLIGVHKQIACTACHVGGVFTGLPTDCFSCHATDYANAKSPDHAGGNFPTTCQTCHTPAGWIPSTFNHNPYFPINSGRHSGFQCSDCHTTGVYTTFSCTSCHDHDKPSTDSQHHGVSGYVYASPNCYACHPRGVAGD